MGKAGQATEDCRSPINAKGKENVADRCATRETIQSIPPDYVVTQESLGLQHMLAKNVLLFTWARVLLTPRSLHSYNRTAFHY